MRKEKIQRSTVFLVSYFLIKANVKCMYSYGDFQELSALRIPHNQI